MEVKRSSTTIIIVTPYLKTARPFNFVSEEVRVVSKADNDVVRICS